MSANVNADCIECTGAQKRMERKFFVLFSYDLWILSA